MRRAMLTNWPSASGITVGNAATNRTNSYARDLVLDLNTPASRAGTLTSVSVYMATAPTEFRIFTGTWDGTTLTVAAATGNLAAAVGLNTFTVSLSIPSGGYLGIYNTGGTLSSDSGLGSSVGLTSGMGAPTAGATYTGLLSDAATISAQGTGS